MGRPCDHAATVSSSFDMKVPQIQFIDSGWIFLLFAETGTTVQTVQFSVEMFQVPLLDRFLTCRYCATPGAFTVVKVVDISVVAQRQSPWSCSDNRRDSPVAVL